MEQEQATTEYALSLIAAGDGAGCDLLHAQLGGAMLAAARAVTGDRAAAEDAVQDAFIRIVRGIRGYRPGTNPRAWVLRIVRNCAIAKIDRHRAANIDEFYNLADGQDCEERACDVERDHGREPPERVDHRRDGRAEDVAAGLDGLRHARKAREVLGRRHERRERLEGGRVKGASDRPHEERDQDHPHGKRSRERDRSDDGAHRRDEEVRADERDLER